MPLRVLLQFPKSSASNDKCLHTMLWSTNGWTQDAVRRLSVRASQVDFAASLLEMMGIGCLIEQTSEQGSLPPCATEWHSRREQLDDRNSGIAPALYGKPVRPRSALDGVRHGLNLGAVILL